MEDRILRHHKYQLSQKILVYTKRGSRNFFWGGGGGGGVPGPTARKRLFLQFTAILLNDQEQRGSTFCRMGGGWGSKKLSHILSRGKCLFRSDNATMPSGYALNWKKIGQA